MPNLAKWTDSIRTTRALHDSTIVNSNGHKIQTYWIYAKHPTHNTVLLIHGINSSAIQMMPIAYMYNHELDYNVFLYDQYAHGKSDGQEIDLGRANVQNALACINIIKNNKRFTTPTHPAPNIVVHGISMGAVTTMLIAEDTNTPSCISAYIEDCGYTDFTDLCEYTAEKIVDVDLPDFPLNSASQICELQNGWSFQEASALEQVKKCQHPMLFIHGDTDDFVPTAMVYPLYEAATCPKELWLTEGVAHALSYKMYPQEYTAKVRSFLEKYVK